MSQTSLRFTSHLRQCLPEMHQFPIAQNVLEHPVLNSLTLLSQLLLFLVFSLTVFARPVVGVPCPHAPWSSDNPDRTLYARMEGLFEKRQAGVSISFRFPPVAVSPIGREFGWVRCGV